MPLWTQHAIVGLCVAAAAFYVARQALASIRGTSGGGSCGGCGSKPGCGGGKSPDEIRRRMEEMALQNGRAKAQGLPSRNSA
jgi:hypothetical protein